MLSYLLPGTTSEEIDNEHINDPNVKEGNERFYSSTQSTTCGLRKCVFMYEDDSWTGLGILVYGA
jgi:hypothetical protein